MHEYSPAFQRLAELCASCGGPLPCALHDAALREAILRPPERAGMPWDKLERREIASYGRSICSFQPLPDGTFLIAELNGPGNGIVVFDPGSHTERVRTVQYYERDHSAYAVRPAGDGTFYAGGTNGDLVRLDLSAARGAQTEVLDNVGQALYAITPVGDGTLLLAGEGGCIEHYDPHAPAGERAFCFVDYDGPIYAVHPLPGGMYLVVDSGGNIVRFDPAKPEGEQEEVLAHRPRTTINSFTALPDGTFLAGGSDGAIALFDPARQPDERLVEIGNFGTSIFAIVTTSDHSFLVAGRGGIIAEYAIPERVMAEWRERKLDQPEIPPMPD